GARRGSSFRTEAPLLTSTITGEKRRWKISAWGLSEPEPLATTRRLYSASPLLIRNRRYRAGPGPRLTPSCCTVRAPDITASAVARSSSRCSKSRRLLKVDTTRLAVAILPSTLIAMSINTNGSVIGSASHHRNDRGG